MEVIVSEAYELKALYWFKNGSSDKIWGFVKTPGGNLFNFWGRRQVVDTEGLTEGGKRPSLSFKKHSGFDAEWDLRKLAVSKIMKGYNEVPISEVDTIVPGFSEFFDYALVTARMTGAVKTDDWDN